MFEEIDFKAKVTREELEELCADLYERIDESVKQALKIADITMVYYKLLSHDCHVIVIIVTGRN